MKWSCTLQWYLCYVGVEDSHIDSKSLLQFVMWSPIINLVKTNRYQFEFHSSPIWNEYHLWSNALSCCGWLASSFDQCLHERTIWNTMTSSLLGVTCFSWSTLLIASTKHIKCPSDHHFHVSLPSTTLGLPTHRWQAPTLGRSDLSPKNHSWYSLELTLFDWSKWWT